LLYVPEIFQAPLATAANALEYRRVSRVSVSPAHNALKWPEISGGEIRSLGRILQNILSCNPLQMRMSIEHDR
jgi:hypothetical protein